MARIFLAENYQMFQTEAYRSIRISADTTLHSNEIVSVKDETIAAGSSVKYHLDTATIILPIVGTLSFRVNDKQSTLNCGELLVINTHSLLEVFNQYDDCLINYLIINFKGLADPVNTLYKYGFDIHAHVNKLLNIVNNNAINISIGKFEMRRETALYHADNNMAHFCFVIQGSFEIEGRLLHERDALAVWDSYKLEIESLGKDSIILLIQQPHREINH